MSYVDVHAWLARATLDAIGKAAFDYSFHALDESDNELARNYKNFVLKTNGNPSYLKTAIQNALFLLPANLIKIGWILPTSCLRRMRQNKEISTRTATTLVDEKTEALGTDLESKDVMSLLVKSNISENPKSQLSKQEMVAQMSTIMFAGHETTANTLTWALWELAKHTKIQSKLRVEIRHWMKLAHANGDETIPVSDYEKMEYTVAVMKETMRFHPIVSRLLRTTGKALSLPLTYPITAPDGTVMNEIPLRKGQRVIAAITCYNRHPDLWGKDPHTFRPERWLEMAEHKVKFGVYGNLGIFGAGIHACIGWRFAVYEMQSFLIEMINKFEFGMTKDSMQVRRVFAGVMVPLLQSDNSRTCMPLTIKSAA